MTDEARLWLVLALGLFAGLLTSLVCYTIDVAFTSMDRRRRVP